MKYIFELYNKHKDQPIWIAGAGPSLDTYPDNFMDDKLAIVLHNAYLKFPNAQYCHANELDRVEWFKENRPEYLDKVCTFAWPFYRRIQQQVEEVIDPDRDNYYFFILRPNSPYSRNVDYVEERIIEVRSGKRMDFGGYGTCLHACMYVCIMMGCNPINIIGCEHKAEPGKDEYFKVAQEASKDLFKRDHVVLGPMQEPSTRTLMEACGRQGIEVNRYFSHLEVVIAKDHALKLSDGK